MTTGPDVDEQDQDDNAGDDSADERSPRGPAAAGRAGSIANDGAGWVLGLIVWAGIVLPFVKHGPAGVKAWWMAKFLNKAPDGSWLP